MIAVDSEFQSLIPPLSDDEYERLERSILAEGVRDPIITWNGTIIDGHNRYHICEEHGIRCPQTEKQFESREAAKIWIIENQFARRNLNNYQRSQLALQLEPLYAAEAKRRMSEGGNSSKVGRQNSDNPLRTDEQLAKLAGVSRDTIRKAKAIETAAESGDETAIAERDALMSGEKRSIHGAYVRVTGDRKPRSVKESTAEDGRKICVMCGEPIDDGDALPSRPTVHKKCEKEYQRDWERGRSTKQTEDGRRICTICGKPIDEGDAYDYRPSVHKACYNERNSTLRYANPDMSLLGNVAQYSIDTLIDELTASVNDFRSSIDESLSINEDKGVLLTRRQRRRISKAIDNVLKAIEAIRGE